MHTHTCTCTSMHTHTCTYKTYHDPKAVGLFVKSNQLVKHTCIIYMHTQTCTYKTYHGPKTVGLFVKSNQLVLHTWIRTRVHAKPTMTPRLYASSSKAINWSWPRVTDPSWALHGEKTTLGRADTRCVCMYVCMYVCVYVCAHCNKMTLGRADIVYVCTYVRVCMHMYITSLCDNYGQIISHKHRKKHQVASSTHLWTN